MTLRVAFAKWWPNFDREHNFLVDALRSWFDVRVGEDPDIVFYSVFQGDLPTGEYLKVFYTGEPRRPDMSVADWAFSYEYDEYFCHPRHMRLPLYVIDVDGGSFRADWGRDLVKHPDYADRVLRQQRPGFCGYVAYYDGPERCAMFDRLSEYRKVTAPGRSRHNASPISDGDPEKSRLNESFQTQKRAWYERFRFALVFENRSYPGYTTEKLVDAMMAGCIPIYWGNPEIARDFNPRSFVDVTAYETQQCARLPRWLHSFPDLYRRVRARWVLPLAFSRAAERVRHIDGDPGLRRKILVEPWLNQNRPSSYFDEARFLERMKMIGIDALTRKARRDCSSAEGSAT